MFSHVINHKKLGTIVFLLVVAAVIICGSPGAKGKYADAGELKQNIGAKEYGVIINLAGKQRMLTQKMSKEALLITVGINEVENRRNLQSTMDLFTKTLKGLEHGDNSLGLPNLYDKQIINQLKNVKLLFNELAPLFTKVIKGSKLSDDELYFLRDKNIPLLLAMNKAVKMYERKARAVMVEETALNIIINLSGKQRMLTQKMTKEFLFIKLGIDMDANKMVIRETVAVFDKVLQGLENGDSDLGLVKTKDGDILKQLKRVRKLWDGFKPVVNKASVVTPDKISINNVVAAAEMNLIILDEMDKAVTMYEALAKQDIKALPIE